MCNDWHIKALNIKNTIFKICNDTLHRNNFVFFKLKYLIGLIYARYDNKPTYNCDNNLEFIVFVILSKLTYYY